MWLICCGARRSGSTVQTQIAAELLKQTGKGIFPIQGIPEKYKRLSNNPNYVKYRGYKVFKTHYNTPEIKHDLVHGKAIGIHCYRDPRDAYLSFLTKLNFDLNDHERTLSNFFYRYINYYNSWKDHLDKIYSSKYEQWYDNLGLEIRNIAGFLNITVKEDLIKSISDKLNIRKNKVNIIDSSVEKDSYSHTHILQSRHINKGAVNEWKSAFSKDSIKKMETISGKFLSEKAYSIENKDLDLDNFLSFADSYEDYFIWTLFDKKPGVFLDINALNGIYKNATASLELNGWIGVCVEPVPNMYKECRKSRIHSTVFENIISDQSKENHEFYYDKSSYYLSDKDDYNELKEVQPGLSPLKMDNINMLSLDTFVKEKEIEENLDLLVVNMRHNTLQQLKRLTNKNFRPKCIHVKGYKDDGGPIKSTYSHLTSEYKTIEINNTSIFYFRDDKLYKKARQILEGVNWQKGAYKISTPHPSKVNYNPFAQLLNQQ